ncbi:MAG: TadE family protein [Microbacterium sp.]|uniref:TadE family protein n=1 Tax=Microbacterium sp. TaxID=51671 RepID=UPI001AC1757E|nr:TadE family protein [Microbacterium sp.]MBN9176057.1 TadE family protein [Microbacterium sp.]
MLLAKASTDDPCAGDDEAGSAALEFILVGLVLLVPIVYLVIALGTIQGQALGVETGARQLARTIAAAPDAATAEARAERVRDAIVREYGLDAAAVAVDISCSRAACPEPGAILTVTVRTEVPLPLVPAILGLDDLARVPVEAASAQKVSRFWGGSP